MGRKRTVALVVLALVDGVGAWWWSGQKRGASQPARRRSNPRSVVPRAIGQGRLIGWWPAAPDQLGVAAPVTSSDSTSNIHPTDYVGPERCRKCHQRNHEDWRQHAHRLMNAVANQETVRGEFSGRATLHQDGGRVTFFEDQETPGSVKRWWMRLVRGDVDRTYRVTQTIGSRFFQYYVGRLAAGPEAAGHQYYTTDHVLPFGYWLEQKQWVPVVHVHREVAGLDREDPFVGAGELKRFAPYAQGCNGCHTTFSLGDMFTREPLRLARHAPWPMHWNLADYIEENRSEFLSRIPAFSEDQPIGNVGEQQLQELGRILPSMDAREHAVTLGISCAACHLGSRRHAEDPTRAPGFAPRSPHLRAETGGREIASGRNQTNLNWVCGRCHAGSRSEFAAGMGTLNSIEYTDATRGACYSQLKCVDCRDPHKAIGQKWTRTRAQDESVCLKCHQKFVSRDVRRQHTHHQAGSPGDGCLECHMPRINEGLQDIVRTHSIFSPIHGEMLEANHPNACNLCHVEATINWTVEWLRKWYDVEVDRLDLDRAYVDKPKSVGEGWLESKNEAVRLVGADAVVRQRTVWSLEFLVARLDDEFLINRQFAARGLEKMLGLDLAELGYRFRESRSERKRGLKPGRELVLGSDSVVAGAGGR